MSSKVYSAQVIGLHPDIIEVEVDIARGLKSYSIVGLPDSAVKEARDRIFPAIKNAGFPSPQRGNKKTIVSLAPADLKKEGPIFDLAIALAYLLENKEIVFNPKGKLFLGELSLDGSLRAIKGVLLIAEQARTKGFKEIYVPKENAREASFVRGVDVFRVAHLREVAEHLEKNSLKKEAHHTITIKDTRFAVEFQDVKGQETAKRGLEIAAAGGHNILMSGPPGTGKTLLAKAFTSILPELTFDEMLEVTGIHSTAGILEEDIVTHPPFRSPHHTSSYVSLVGGGTYPRPGEITLAHRGVLFLDEFPEFDRRVIESLRQPLEDRHITISRIRGSSRFPANIILIATMNPCPCGNKGIPDKACICSPLELSRYRRKISAPILDRIDISVYVPHVSAHKMLSQEPDGEESKVVRERVMKARKAQHARFSKEKKLRTNSDMGVKEIKKYLTLTPELASVFEKASAAYHLSPRAYHRVLKVARTIADLLSFELIQESHLLEALQYRPKTDNHIS